MNRAITARTFSDETGIYLDIETCIKCGSYIERDGWGRWKLIGSYPPHRMCEVPGPWIEGEIYHEPPYRQDIF